MSWGCMRKYMLTLFIYTDDGQKSKPHHRHRHHGPPIGIIIIERLPALPPPCPVKRGGCARLFVY
eukprot:2674485-Karenia_brevis.AAC.1